VDTSVWIDHLRRGNDRLRSLLEEGEVLCHPFIIGELALGNLRNRSGVLSLLDALPQAVMAEHGEVMRFTDEQRLMGRGLGYVDAHLLASALLTGAPLWTRDRKLDKACAGLTDGG
jgi:predicted nucleic acid-binding protein